MPLSTYTYPPSCPSSPAYRLAAEGQAQFVYHTAVADFAAFGADGPVQVQVILPAGTGAAAVHPLSRGISAEREGDCLRFRLPGPGNYVVQPEGLNPLFLYVNPLDLNLPTAGETVRRIPAGTLVEAGSLTLRSGETLCIEPGAVVRGSKSVSMMPKRATVMFRSCTKGRARSCLSRGQTPEPRNAPKPSIT